MALVTCKECGKQISSSAKKCPSCGAKLRMGLFGRILLGFAALFVFSVAITGMKKSNQAPLTPQEQKMDDQKNEAVKRAWSGYESLHQEMRDPDSFQATSIAVMIAGGACYEYRAKNEFGGMSGGLAVLSRDGKTLLTNSQIGFKKLWVHECKGAHWDVYDAGSLETAAL